MKQRAHYVLPYILEPYNPIEVLLIGAGGTGSQVLTCLARMNHALNELGHPGLKVRLLDPDKVSESNLGRQLFAETEVGLHKSVALINRINRFFGTKWIAETVKFQNSKLQADIYISCLDNVAGRVELAEMFNVRKPWNSGRITNAYWMDFGNSKSIGQVLLSTVSKRQQPESDKYEAIADLPFITDEFGIDALTTSEDGDDTPSCSLAEALEKQDLFINSTLAQMGASLLWSLFRQGVIFNRGFFLNLENFRSQAIAI